MTGYTLLYCALAVVIWRLQMVLGATTRVIVDLGKYDITPV